MMDAQALLSQALEQNRAWVLYGEYAQLQIIMVMIPSTNQSLSLFIVYIKKNSSMQLPP